MENTALSVSPNKIFAPIMGAIVFSFIALAIFAGLPPADSIGGFVIGLVFLIGFTSLFAAALWHLLLRPMPAALPATERIPISALTRSIIALLLTLATLSTGIAGIWDEIWHRKYGIPFGEDFFWRPHIMLYFSFLILIGLGAWSWLMLMNRGKGTLQQRFRANPLLASSFLAGVYTIYALGADPIWHGLYGEDLSPWSIPHLLILIMILVMATLNVTYHKSLIPHREWQVMPSFSWRDLLMIVIWGGALISFTLIFTVEWYVAEPSSADLLKVLQYPDWLLGIFITFLAMLFGTMALHSTRRMGTATLVGLFSLGVRMAIEANFSGTAPGTYPYLIMLALLVTLDLWYAFSISRTGKPPVYWMTGIVIAATYGLLSYPLLASLFPFLPVSVGYIPLRFLASLITALGTIWCAQAVSELTGYGYQGEPAAAPKTQASNVMTMRWADAVIYSVFALGLVFFMATATPPV